MRNQFEYGGEPVLNAFWLSVVHLQIDEARDETEHHHHNALKTIIVLK